MGLLLVGTTLGIGGSVAWLLSKPPSRDCQIGNSLSPQEIHASRVVVQPWLGRHEVYGIFVIPLRFRSSRTYTGTLWVDGFKDQFAPDGQFLDQHEEGVVVEPGNYLMRGYIPTRVALWFLFTGQLDELRSPCNWTIEFSARSEQ